MHATSRSEEEVPRKSLRGSRSEEVVPRKLFRGSRSDEVAPRKSSPRKSLRGSRFRGSGRQPTPKVFKYFARTTIFCLAGWGLLCGVLGLTLALALALLGLLATVPGPKESMAVARGGVLLPLTVSPCMGPPTPTPLKRHCNHRQKRARPCKDFCPWTGVLVFDVDYSVS